MRLAANSTGMRFKSWASIWWQQKTGNSCFTRHTRLRDKTKLYQVFYAGKSCELRMCSYAHGLLTKIYFRLTDIFKVTFAGRYTTCIRAGIDQRVYEIVSKNKSTGSPLQLL